jgi:hypothetical protein
MDRITNILQSNAPQPPSLPTDPMAAWQAQVPNGYSNPNIDAATTIMQQAQQGNPQAVAAIKSASNFVKPGDTEALNSYLNYIHDLPEQIDPSNSYQVMTAGARWAKDTGYNAQGKQTPPDIKMPSPLQIATQDKANIFNGKGSDITGLEQTSAKNLASIDKLEAIGSGSGSSGGVTGFMYKKMRSALEASGVQITPDMDLQLLNVSRNGLQKGATITVNGKDISVENLLGTTGMLEAQKYAEGYGNKSGDLTAEGQLKPGVERATSQAQQEGTAQGQQVNALADQVAAYPQLERTIGRLQTLAQDATYTYAGKGVDIAAQQLFGATTKGALALSKYKNTVRDVLLPQLRQTFGAAFTAEEGQRLEETLGGADMTPEQRQGALEEYLRSKFESIKTLKRRTGNTAPQGNTPPASPSATDPLGIR